MVVAFVALFMAIGGGSYALAQLPSRSVGSTQLKRGAVKNANLANNAVTGAKIRSNSVTGSDIRESSLRGVASATAAASATNATHANAAAALDRVVYTRQAGSVGPGTVPDPVGDPTNVVATISGASATCPAGTFAVGGGVGVNNNQDTSVVDSFPEPGGRAWSVRVDNSSTTTQTFTVVAVCLAAGAAG
jgi:hypothetical protein